MEKDTATWKDKGLGIKLSDEKRDWMLPCWAGVLTEALHGARSQGGWASTLFRAVLQHECQAQHLRRLARNSFCVALERAFRWQTTLGIKGLWVSARSWVLGSVRPAGVGSRQSLWTAEAFFRSQCSPVSGSKDRRPHGVSIEVRRDSLGIGQVRARRVAWELPAAQSARKRLEQELAALAKL